MKTKIALIFWIIFIVVFAVKIATNTHEWSPIDDQLFFQSAKQNIWFGISQAYNGRFFPLHGLDYFICYLIKKENLTLVYTFSALVFLATAWFVYKNQVKSFLSQLVLFLLILGPGISCIFFRLSFQERWILLFWSVLIFLLHQKSNISAWKVILFANLIIFSKEPGIAAMFVTGISFILKSYLNYEPGKKELRIGIALFLSSILAIVLWMLLVVPNTVEWYGRNNIPIVINFLKSLVEWSLADPFLFFVFIPICIHRILEIYKTKSINSYDCLAFGGIGYIGTFFITGTGFAFHYLVPVYAVAVPYVFYFFSKRGLGTYFVYKRLLALSIVIMIWNIPKGLNDVVFQKYNNKNFTEIIETFDSILSNKQKDERVNFYILGGQDWGDNTFAYGLFPFLLEKYQIKDFDILSYEKSMNPHKPDWEVPFTFMNTEIVSKPTKGDYVLITPYTKSEYRKISSRYILLKKWSGPKNIPNPGIMDLVRFLSRKIGFLNPYIRNKTTPPLQADYSLYIVI